MLAKELSVNLGNVRKIFRVSQVESGSDHILGRSPKLFYRLANDLQASSGLGPSLTRSKGLSLGVQWSSTGDLHPVSNAQCAAEPGLGFERGTRKNTFSHARRFAELSLIPRRRWESRVK